MYTHITCVVVPTKAHLAVIEQPVYFERGVFGCEYRVAEDASSKVDRSSRW